MKMLLGFLPFAMFAVGDHFFSTLIALALAAATAAALTARDLLAKRGLKLLDAGAAVVFGGLAAYTLLAHAEWSVLGVRLSADIGLFTVVAFSIAIGKPFTLQYAKEMVPPAIWEKPAFYTRNKQISLFWLGAFAGMVLLDFAMMHGLPSALGVAGTVGVLAGAMFFTKKSSAVKSTAA